MGLLAGRQGLALESCSVQILLAKGPVPVLFYGIPKIAHKQSITYGYLHLCQRHHIQRHLEYIVTFQNVFDAWIQLPNHSHLNLSMWTSHYQNSSQLSSQLHSWFCAWGHMQLETRSLHLGKRMWIYQNITNKFGRLAVSVKFKDDGMWSFKVSCRMNHRMSLLSGSI